MLGSQEKLKAKQNSTKTHLKLGAWWLIFYCTPPDPSHPSQAPWTRPKAHLIVLVLVVVLDPLLQRSDLELWLAEPKLFCPRKCLDGQPSIYPSHAEAIERQINPHFPPALTLIVIRPHRIGVLFSDVEIEIEEVARTPMHGMFGHGVVFGAESAHRIQLHVPIDVSQCPDRAERRARTLAQQVGITQRLQVSALLAKRVIVERVIQGVGMPE